VLKTFTAFAIIAKSVFARDHNSEQSEARSLRIYNFPPIWQPATLLANDTAAQPLWAKIEGGVPNILFKG
jgi:hypothetical protein